MDIIKKHENYLTNPFKEIEEMQRAMNCLIDFPLSRFFGTDTPLSVTSWAPAVDIIESENEVLVKAELPGMDKKDIDVTIDGNILRIKGEKKKDEKIKKEHYYRTERFYGSFVRNIMLNSDIDSSKAKADFKEGVLELILPKLETAKPKQIKLL